MEKLLIWIFAFFYFLVYIPYTILNGGIVKGWWASPLPGFSVLPWSTAASAVGMLAFFTISGWWRKLPRRVVVLRASSRGSPTIHFRFPGVWRGVAGLATAGVVLTTTLAYCIRQSILLMMLYMRGGVLLITPLIDLATGRRVRWFSWAATGLSLAALLVAFLLAPKLVVLSPTAKAVVLAYIAFYAVRLIIMSRLGKSPDPEVNRCHFTEEQIVATPAAFLFLVVFALVGDGEVAHQVRQGFAAWHNPKQLALLVAIGLCSQGVGVFGALVLMQKQEGSFCMPLNRASSVFAGVAANILLWAMGRDELRMNELIGAAIMIVATMVLGLPDLAVAWRSWRQRYEQSRQRRLKRPQATKERKRARRAQARARRKTRASLAR